MEHNGLTAPVRGRKPDVYGHHHRHPWWALALATAAVALFSGCVRAPSPTEPVEDPRLFEVTRYQVECRPVALGLFECAPVEVTRGR